MLSKAKCFQLYSFFFIYNEITGFLPLLSLLPLNRSPFKTCRETDRIKHLFWSQFTFTDNPNERRFLCATNLWCHFLLFNASMCNYTFKIKKNDIEIVPRDFRFSTPGKWFVSGFSEHGDVSRIHDHEVYHWIAELSLRLSTNAFILCKAGELDGAYLAVNSNLPEQRLSIFDNNFDKMQGATLWQAKMKVWNNFCSSFMDTDICSYGYEINTFKFSWVYIWGCRVSLVLYQLN